MTNLKKSLLKTLCAVVFVSMVSCGNFFAGSAHAEGLTASASVDFVSKYIWRGFNLSDGWNTQPGVELEMSGLTLGYWGSFNWDQDDNNSEQDFYIGYGWNASEGVGLSVGFTQYIFPSAASSEDHTEEAWFGISLDEMPLSPSLTLFVDFGDEKDGGADGEYLVLSIGHALELSDGFSLDWGAGIGYNNDFFIDENGFADFTPSLGLSWAVNERLSLSATANYSVVVDSDVEDAMGSDDEFVGVFNISVS